MTTSSSALLAANWSEWVSPERLEPSPIIRPSSISTTTQSNPPTTKPTTTTTGSSSKTPFPLPAIFKPYAPTPTSARRLRPLSMSHTPNLPPIDDRDDREDGKAKGSCVTVGRTRLKRLSLLSKPIGPSTASASSSILTSQGSSRSPNLPDPIEDVAEPQQEAGAQEAGPSTVRGDLRKGRERNVGVRSSISYAYSPHTTMGGRGAPFPGGAGQGEKGGDVQRDTRAIGLWMLEEDGSGPLGSGSTGEVDVMEGTRAGKSGPRGIRDKIKGVTLTEKHADLLTLIAQKERRVNELKLKLAQQETSLNQLKSKWTTIVSRSTTQPFTTRSSISSSSSSSSSSTTGHPPDRPSAPGTGHRRSINRPRPLTSTDLPISPSNPNPDPTDISSLLDLNAEDNALVSAQNVLNNLIATAYGPEGVVTPSAVEGGRRFWWQLVKTVSAAAGGNVPVSSLQEGEREDQGGGGTLDLNALTSIVSLPSWANLAAPPPPSSTTNKSSRPIPHPANLNRLPRSRNRETSSTFTSFTSTMVSISSNTSDNTTLKTPLTARDSSQGVHLASPQISLSPSLTEGERGASGMSSFLDLMDLQEFYTGSDQTKGVSRSISEEKDVQESSDRPMEKDDGAVDEDEWGL